MTIPMPEMTSHKNLVPPYTRFNKPTLIIYTCSIFCAWCLNAGELSVRLPNEVSSMYPSDNFSDAPTYCPTDRPTNIAGINGKYRGKNTIGRPAPVSIVFSNRPSVHYFSKEKALQCDQTLSAVIVSSAMKDVAGCFEKLSSYGVYTLGLSVGQ